MKWAIPIAACVVACAWVSDAGRKKSVASVRWHHPVVAKAVEPAPVVLAALHVEEPLEPHGPPAPLRRDTKAEMSAADILRIDHVADATDYLKRTATAGFTMTKQGKDVAIGYMQPDCRVRFAGAIREARANGLPHAGIYSGYRRPDLGVGGFPNKLESTHAAGLAADMTGIGRPGSKEAIKWWLIAGRHKLVVQYGPWHRVEWNHTACTDTKVMKAGLPVRKTYTKAGPAVLGDMWKAAALLMRPTFLIPKSVKPPTRYAKKIKKTRYARHQKRRHYASAS